MPVTKREFVEILIKCCLVIMALVVVFGNQTFAEGTADDEVLIYIYEQNVSTHRQFHPGCRCTPFLYAQLLCRNPYWNV